MRCAIARAQKPGQQPGSWVLLVMAAKQGSDCDASGCSRFCPGGEGSSLCPFAGAMWPLLLLLLLGLPSCVKTQLLFNTIKSVEYTKNNKTVLIPCFVTNGEPESLAEIFVKWKFKDKYIFFYDGEKNESKPIREFSSAYIIPNALLTGNASLMMDKSHAVPGNYTCEVTELTREGETTIELKYISVKTELLFTTIKSVEYTKGNKTDLIPCLVTNSAAKSLKEMFVKWKFRNKYIFYYDGEKNESKPTSDFSSACIIPDALLTGNASLMMDKSQAVPGNYTCEVTELTREGETTIELNYHVALWFSANDHILTIIFPMLTVFLFWESDIMI